MRVTDDAIEHNQDLAFYQGEPFTGEVVEQGEDGSLATLYSYKSGILDGLYREWYANNQLYQEGKFHFGLPVGIHRRWHPNGQLAKESIFGEAAVLLRARTWDSHGKPLTDSATQ